MNLKTERLTMKTLLTSLALGLAAFGAAERAHAASLDVVTGAPVIDVPSATADYSEVSGAGDLSLFDAEALSPDLSSTGTLLLNLAVNFDASAPSATADGVLLSEDDDGPFLDGTLVEAGYDNDILQLLYGDLTGSAAGDFGGFALLEVFFIALFPGTDPLSNLVDGITYDVSATVSSAAPIPLTAGLPLLLAGLGGLLMLRRRA